VLQDGTNEIISRLMSLSARSGAPSRPTHSPPPLEGGTSSAARARCQHTLCPRSAVQSCDAAACKSWPKPSTLPSVLLMQSLIESNRRRASGSGAARGCYARTPDAARASRLAQKSLDPGGVHFALACTSKHLKPSPWCFKPSRSDALP
jgi:hypothetical protein